MCVFRCLHVFRASGQSHARTLGRRETQERRKVKHPAKEGQGRGEGIGGRRDGERGGGGR